MKSLIVASVLSMLSISPALANDPLIDQAQKMVEEINQLELAMPKATLEQHVDRLNPKSATLLQMLELNKVSIMLVALRAVEFQTMKPEEIPVLKTSSPAR